MAKKKKVEEEKDDFTLNLINQLNKENGERIAFNLSSDDAPTNIKRWISTGSRQLDVIIANSLDGGLPEGRVIEIQGPTSCHAVGDRVLLYDGRTIAVEHVKIGDELLGPDGKPRMVLKLVQGEDDLYKVTQKRSGYSYTFNTKHKLALKCVESRRKNYGETTFVSVEDYLTQSNWWKRCHHWYHSSIEEFSGTKPRELPIPAYILGLLLGDGSLEERRIELTSADDAIKDSFISYIKECGFEPRFHYKKDNKATGTYYATGIRSNQFLYENQKSDDQIKNALRQLELLGTKSGTKFIPDAYKYACSKERKEILAGLMDTDGHYNRNGNFDYVTKSKRLAEDVRFVANSLGLFVSQKIKVANGNEYFRLNIGGNVSIVPTKLERKQPKPSSRRNQLCVGFRVEKQGFGKYYGFTVDGDNLYLGQDFSVIRNSGKSHIAFEAAKDTQKKGGIVVYIDTENATSLDNLQALGIDVKHRFVFCQTACTEEIFAIIESTIMKARAMVKDVPVTIFWDSVAASSPKAELEGDYDQNSIGLQARVLGKGMRKIVNIIGNQNVTLVLINQQRQKIGVMFGDPCLSPDSKITVRRKQTDFTF